MSIFRLAALICAILAPEVVFSQETGGPRELKVFV